MRRRLPYHFILLLLLALWKWPPLWPADGDDEAVNAPGSHPSIQARAAQSKPAAVFATLPPWAATYAKYRDGHYADLVANAWAAPERGSMHFASRAIGDCLMFLYRDAPERYRRKIESDPEVREARELAWKALTRPCRGLADPESLLGERDRLHRAMDGAADAASALVIHRARELTDAGLERSMRQAKLEELLSLNEPYAMSVALGALTRPGATFEGETLGFFDRVAYMAAWERVRCIGYRECWTGPDTRQGHLDCLNHAHCGYWTSEDFFRLFPGFVGERVTSYHRRIQAHLDRRRYSAFGVP